MIILKICQWVLRRVSWVAYLRSLGSIFFIRFLGLFFPFDSRAGPCRLEECKRWKIGRSEECSIPQFFRLQVRNEECSVDTSQLVIVHCTSMSCCFREKALSGRKSRNLAVFTTFRFRRRWTKRKTWQQLYNSGTRPLTSDCKKPLPSDFYNGYMINNFAMVSKSVWNVSVFS